MSLASRKYAPLLFLALSGFSDCSAQNMTVYRCESEDGSIVFSDRECAADAEAISVTASKGDRGPSPYENESGPPGEEQAQDLETDGLPPAVSFLCIPVDGQPWYQHDPCPRHLKLKRENHVNVAGPVGVLTADGFAPAVGGGGSATIETNEYIPVDQKTVTTKEACDNGAPNKSELFDFAHGPCSFVGMTLRRQAQHAAQ